MTMTEDALSTDGAKAGNKKFTIVLLTIYSVENAGIRYVSAALQRAGFETHIIFLRDWVHNRLEMPSDQDIRMALDIIREKEADLRERGGEFTHKLLRSADGARAPRDAATRRVLHRAQRQPEEVEGQLPDASVAALELLPGRKRGAGLGQRRATLQLPVQGAEHRHQHQNLNKYFN